MLSEYQTCGGVPLQVVGLARDSWVIKCCSRCIDGMNDHVVHLSYRGMVR